jgi:zinc/manganese transport system ATP-binding protein
VSVPRTSTPPSHPVSVPPADHPAYAVNVDGLGVRFGSRQVLEDVSFQLSPGSVAGLIGANGAGKTTLLRAILGRQPLTAGRVEIAGRIGYVPQKFLLDPDLPLRGRDLVGLGLDGHRFGLSLPSRARRDRVAEMLEAVGASGFADTRVGRLSGGEQQRILIAHALIGEPALLLLDEPLANLDLHSAKQSVELLARIARTRNLAVFISAHELNQLLPVLDHVVYLADGRAVAGRTDEVIRQDVLSRLYRSHVDVIRVHGRVLVVAGQSGQVVS